MKIIPPQDLVLLDWFAPAYPVRSDLVYARAGDPENVFKTGLYHPDAKMVGHIDLAAVILLAAKRLQAERGWTLVLKDCLRPVEAQQRMMETDLVRANPHWLIEPRFLSPPGMGGHPRGMAVDIWPEDANGVHVDMGTPFDFFAGSTDPDNNPSHRLYKKHSESVMQNRKALEDAMMRAAGDLGLPMLPLPQEWWDFRFPATYANDYQAIEDKTLPHHLRMMEQPAPAPKPEDVLDRLHRRFLGGLFV